MSYFKDSFCRTVLTKYRSIFPKKPQYLRSYPAASLPGLPIELILHIASFLRPHEKVLLILTCKQLLHTLGARPLRTIHFLLRERKLFMHLLERDLPNHYAYYYYLRPKLLQSYPSNFKVDSKHHYLPDRGWMLLYERFGYAVMWSHVVFALRADSLGASYGIPLDAFDYAAKQRRDGDLKPTGLKAFKKHLLRKAPRDAQVKLSVRARIVSDHLVLRCTYTISHKTRSVDRDDLKTLGLDVCSHITTKDRQEPWFDNILAEALQGPSYNYATDDDDIAEENDSDGGTDPWVQSAHSTLNASSSTLSSTVDRDVNTSTTEVEDMEDGLGRSAAIELSGQCNFCFTEYEVRGLTLDDKDAVEVVAWHDLGDAKSKDGVFWEKTAHWHALVGGVNVTDCMFRYMNIHSIRDAFESGDGSRLHCTRTQLVM